MASSINSERQPLRPLENPNVEVSNKATQIAKKMAITLVAIGAIGALITFASHGPLSVIASDAMVVGAGGAAIAGTAYAGLKFMRDRRQANQAKEGLKDAVAQEDIESAIGSASFRDGDSYKRNVEINGKRYEMEVIKQNNGIGRINLKNK